MCMHVHVHVHVYVYVTCIRMYGYTFVSTRAGASARMYHYLAAYANTKQRICTHAYGPVRVRVRVRVRMHVECGMWMPGMCIPSCAAHAMGMQWT